MKNLLILASSAYMAIANVQADTIFSDDFQDGSISAWSSSGSGTAVSNLYVGNYSLRVNLTKSAAASFSTAGYTAVTVAVDLAAYSLERADVCYAEASSDGGLSWSTLISVADGSDNSVFSSYSGSPSGADNNSNFQLRVRSAGNRSNDYCYLDNVLVEGAIDNGGGGSGSPEITVTGSGDLGSVQANSSATSVITVSNDGDAALSVSALSGLSAPFSLSVDNCSNTLVAAGDSCTATIEFSPIAAGSFSDTLSINSDDSDESVVSVSVSGTAVEDDTGGSCDYDCLTGDGNVSRSTVTYAN